MSFRNIAMKYVDPPLVPTRWWLPLRLLQRAVPLVVTILPISAFVNEGLFWGLAALLVLGIMALAGWSVASNSMTGWGKVAARATNIYIGFAIAVSALTGAVAPVFRPEPLSPARTLLVAVLMCLFMLIGEKMWTRGAGKPVRPAVLTDSAPSDVATLSGPTRRTHGEPGLIDVAAVVLVVLAAWRPRRR